VRGSRGAFAVGVLAASGHDAREMGSLRARNPKWAGWFVLALMTAPAPSFAAEPSKTALAAARELFSRAERDEDNGQWADALDKLLRAGSVKMTSGIRFHIALCEEKLGKLANALGDYVMAEAAARSEGNNEVLEATLDPLASLRVRVPTLTITLPADARDAETTLDGARLPTELLGTAIPINVGSHLVTADATGRPPFSASIQVNERQALDLEVRFPSDTLAPHFFLPSTGRAAPERPSGSPRGAAIATTAGAIALVGFGALAYFVAGDKQSRADTQCPTLTSCDNLKPGVRAWDALALGGWIAGAGVGAVSVYLWTRPANGGQIRWGGELSIGSGSLWVTGEF
jgi:hypothetical protein